ncbi:MAG: hypothetical protein AAGA91_01840 [Pseudomonadota bacterium]
MKTLNLAVCAAILALVTVSMKAAACDGDAKPTDPFVRAGSGIEAQFAQVVDDANPLAAEGELAAPSESGTASGSDQVVVIPDTHNEEVEAEDAIGEPHEVLDAEPRHEVGDFATENSD